MNYYVSFGLKGDDAMYKESSTKYTQYNVRAKVDMPITDWLKTGIELAGFQVNRVLSLQISRCHRRTVNTSCSDNMVILAHR